MEKKLTWDKVQVFGDEEILSRFFKAYLNRSKEPKIRIIRASLDDSDEGFHQYDSGCFCLGLFLPQAFLDICKKFYKKEYDWLIKTGTSQQIEKYFQDYNKWVAPTLGENIIFHSLYDLEKKAEQGDALISETIFEINRKTDIDDGISDLITSVKKVDGGIEYFLLEASGDPYDGCSERESDELETVQLELDFMRLPKEGIKGEPIF